MTVDHYQQGEHVGCVFEGVEHTHEQGTARSFDHVLTIGLGWTVSHPSAELDADPMLSACPVVPALLALEELPGPGTYYVVPDEGGGVTLREQGAGVPSTTTERTDTDP